MDERIKGEYRRIYAEILPIIMVVLAGSILVKFSILKWGWQSCVTEMLILVVTPIYMMIRQNMLGIWTHASVSSRKRKINLVVTLLASFAGYAFSSLSRHEKFTVFDIVNVGIFLITFLFVYWSVERINQHFYNKKMKQYEEDDTL